MHSTVPSINTNKTSPPSTLPAAVCSALAGQSVPTRKTHQPPEHRKNTGEESDRRRVTARFTQSKKPFSRAVFFFLSITSLLIALITKDGVFQVKARHGKK